MAKVKSKVVRLFSFDSDEAAWIKQAANLKQAKLCWDKSHQRQGKSITYHPTNSCQSFLTLKQAQTAAQQISYYWYYLTEYQIAVEDVAKMFDGIGMDATPCLITKVHPLVKVKRQ